MKNTAPVIRRSWVQIPVRLNLGYIVLLPSIKKRIEPKSYLNQLPYIERSYQYKSNKNSYGRPFDIHTTGNLLQWPYIIAITIPDKI